MAKDTRGHGSEKRGLNSARGMAAAKKFLAAQIKNGLMNPPTDAQKLRDGTGHKSDRVATHDAMYDSNPGLTMQVHGSKFDSSTHNEHGNAWGSPAALADFKRQYGRRAHADPAKGFASGKREINRLKKQGK